MDGDLLWLAAFGHGLGFPALDEGVNGVDFALLIQDPPRQFFTLFLVLDLVFLVLAKYLLIFLATDDDPFLDNMQLIQQACVFLLGSSEFGFQLFIPEGGGLDVFVDYFLHLHYLLHHFLHLHWPLDVDWLHPHLPLHPPCCLELAG